MVEIELNPKRISKWDNTANVEMSKDEIWFLKNFIKKYNPKKIVEIGISAGGNTVNLLKWKDKDAQLFSIDIAKQWYQDKAKLSGWMVDEVNVKDNFKIYRGYDYLDVYKEIGNDIDCIIIDTVHFMPGEFLSFLVALPQLKDGCIVILHDIHLNIIRSSRKPLKDHDIYSHCTGLLFGSVSSKNKYSLKTDSISNIGAFVVDKSTRSNIKDVFRVLCSAWSHFPVKLNLAGYLQYIHENYPKDCYNIFKTCLNSQAKYFNINLCSDTARIDLINKNSKNNAVKFLNVPEGINVNFPDWLKSEKGSGAVILTKLNSFDIKFRCIESGKLEIALKGPYKRDESNNPVHQYVYFNKVTLNNMDIIKCQQNVCHNRPYIFEKFVRNGELIKLHVEWQNLFNEVM